MHLYEKGALFQKKKKKAVPWNKKWGNEKQDWVPHIHFNKTPLTFSEQ